MHLKVVSFQVADAINIKLFKRVFAVTTQYTDADELFYQIVEYKYLYVIEIWHRLFPGI